MTEAATSTPAWTHAVPAVTLRIGAERIENGSGGIFRHTSPATGQLDAEYCIAGASEIDLAAQTASTAFASWRRTPGAERRRLLLRLADLIEQSGDRFAVLGALDNGMTVAGHRAQVPTSVEWIRYYAGWADKLTGDVVSTLRDDVVFGYTTDDPYGVIGIIITWNGPLISLAMKVAPALAAGNTVVIKPAEGTPFTGQLFMDLVEEAGFPAGVVNLILGGGQELVAHPLVEKVTFTGGPVTARKILHQCADLMKPSVMELGGKSANIIFEDADLDLAVAHGTKLSVGHMSGQGCAFASRMLVQDTIYEEVIERVVATVKTFRIGSPFNEDTVLGPVFDQAAVDRILAMISQATADGARLLLGGGQPGGDLAAGCYIEPTIFADVDPAAQLCQQEVFGPVLAILPFSTEAQAIELANSTGYALSGYINTRDLLRAHRVAGELVTGEVMINGAKNLHPNRPFGGFHLSGFGKEGGRQGIAEFLRTKAVAVSQ